MIPEPPSRPLTPEELAVAQAEIAKAKEGHEVTLFNELDDSCTED